MPVDGGLRAPWARALAWERPPVHRLPLMRSTVGAFEAAICEVIELDPFSNIPGKRSLKATRD
ncbi:hypothetical protein KSE_35730 [Kitasatospora setae KM-6054]|uniref:Uncharacterized protein n=1 Tax=Kitasatospora setae (strain ATCC 33774 / DSM 43861 / JCM 3304 / KCC A-0304 / NBRC 14216 / KM-6054) TaxID=452652 RepID=E4NDU7_KITSK|nr:hypothetical protein KSE_35730 [Kitasatospora setae KM-6054]